MELSLTLLFLPWKRGWKTSPSKQKISPSLLLPVLPTLSLLLPSLAPSAPLVVPFPLPPFPPFPLLLPSLLSQSKRNPSVTLPFPLLLLLAVLHNKKDKSPPKIDPIPLKPPLFTLANLVLILVLLPLSPNLSLPNTHHKLLLPKEGLCSLILLTLSLLLPLTTPLIPTQTLFLLHLLFLKIPQNNLNNNQPSLHSNNNTHNSIPLNLPHIPNNNNSLLHNNNILNNSISPILTLLHNHNNHNHNYNNPSNHNYSNHSNNNSKLTLLLSF
mmetsp:Transcript_23114/g.36006  ORF Transcript_23114/g.36006 Transcript_23114/m.36006 type:complete len:270 (-) Transcript_23114:1476-2285(-)